MRLFTFIMSTIGLFQYQAVHAVDFPFLNISVPECWDQDTMLGAGHIYKQKTVLLNSIDCWGEKNYINKW